MVKREAKGTRTVSPGVTIHTSGTHPVLVRRSHTEASTEGPECYTGEHCSQSWTNSDIDTSEQREQARTNFIAELVIKKEAEQRM
jgi:hypothetical protein